MPHHSSSGNGHGLRNWYREDHRLRHRDRQQDRRSDRVPTAPVAPDGAVTPADTIKVKVEKDLMPPPPVPDKRRLEFATPEPRVKRERGSPPIDSRAGSRARTATPHDWRRNPRPGSRETPARSVASTSLTPGPSRMQRTVRYSSRTSVLSTVNRSSSFAPTEYADPVDPYSGAGLARRSRARPATPAGPKAAVPRPPASLPDGLGRAVSAAREAVKALCPGADDVTAARAVIGALFAEPIRTKVNDDLGGLGSEEDLVAIIDPVHVSGAITAIRGMLNSVLLGAPTTSLNKWWGDEQRSLVYLVRNTREGASTEDAVAVLQSAGIEWRKKECIHRVATAVAAEQRRAPQPSRTRMIAVITAFETLASTLIRESW